MTPSQPLNTECQPGGAVEPFGYVIEYTNGKTAFARFDPTTPANNRIRAILPISGYSYAVTTVWKRAAPTPTPPVEGWREAVEQADAALERAHSLLHRELDADFIFRARDSIKTALALPNPAVQPCCYCKGEGCIIHEGGDSTQSVPEYEDCPHCSPPTAPAVQPEGYKLVPVEPTREMWAAMGDAICDLQRRYIGNHDKISEAVWAAGVSASPDVQPVGSLRDAAKALIAGMSSTYRARNGRDVGIEADDGEKVWLVHSDLITALEAALASPDVQRQEEGEGWRDIASAKHEHGLMILAPNRYGVVDTICWNSNRGDAGSWDDGLDHDIDGEPLIYEPEVWMPVPALPAAPGAGG